MKLSNLTVNLAMRSRSSSKPKLMLGRESAIDGASADERGGRIVLVEREDSKALGIVMNVMLDLVREYCMIVLGVMFLR